MKSLRLNNIIFSCVLLMLLSHEALAGQAAALKARVTPIDVATSNDLLKACRNTITTKYKITYPPVPIVNQSFKITLNSNVYFIISAWHKSPKDYPPTCSVLLIDNRKNLLNLVNTVGPTHDIRPWTCDGTMAMSFLDYYPDGSLKIVALYGATAPSSESFTVPVILRLDFNKSSLTLDEKLTSKFYEIEVDSISQARAIINSTDLAGR